MQRLDQNNLKKLQVILLTQFEILDKVFRENNINYWIDGGTLIGALRHKGFIPWDDDLDISMTRADFNKFQKIANEILPGNLFLQTCHNSPGVNFGKDMAKIRLDDSVCVFKHENLDMPYHQGIFIDVFIYNTFDERIVKYKELEKYYNYITPKGIRGVFKRLYKSAMKRTGYIKSVKDLFHSCENLANYSYINHLNTPNLQDKSVYFPLKKVKFEHITTFMPNKYETHLVELFDDYMTPPAEKYRVPSHIQQIKFPDA